MKLFCLFSSSRERSERGPISRRDLRTVPNCHHHADPTLAGLFDTSSCVASEDCKQKHEKALHLDGVQHLERTRDSIWKTWSVVYYRRWQPRETELSLEESGEEWFSIKQKQTHEVENKERKRNTHREFFILVYLFSRDKQALRSWQIREIRASCKQPRVLFV